MPKFMGVCLTLVCARVTATWLTVKGETPVSSLFGLSVRGRLRGSGRERGGVAPGPAGRAGGAKRGGAGGPAAPRLEDGAPVSEPVQRATCGFTPCGGVGDIMGETST